MKVRTPAGQTYRITRRWVPWQRKSRRMSLDGFDVPLGPPSGDDPISAILMVLWLIIALPIIVVVVAVMLLTGIELLLLLAILPFAVGARVVFGRHWTVEVRRGFTPIHEERAGRWAASAVRISELAREIESGNVPADTLTKQPAKQSAKQS
ncbi:hypothetical protein SAMN05428985_11340 [Nocardioides sp. YR527]|uniref:hypothetical protein n=1 Tax=Nocardioides sp. YR527 TaxID=1881028 RepID=UPI0008853C39|nr:hypothetical protein [Nocardioides sp. YR527]SDL28981.1 hypothetical protein SAMN05428985_11340 [Nocardioides sp. YR527]